MTKLDLDAIKARTEKNASLRSDDFGHDCQTLLVAESDALQVAADDIASLVDEVERLRSLEIDHLQDMRRIQDAERERDQLKAEHLAQLALIDGQAQEIKTLKVEAEERERDFEKLDRANDTWMEAKNRALAKLKTAREALERIAKVDDVNKRTPNAE